MKFIFKLCAATLLFVSPALADDPATLGAAVFKKCMVCHENEKGVTKIGPTLKGIVGRKTASIEGYNYSAAMAKKGADGQVWDDATLTAYLANPQAYIPGIKMAFPGLQNSDDIANLIAYLKTKP